MNAPPEARAGFAADLPAVAAVAATYAYFLLFDQFALLDLLQAALPAAGAQQAMAAMGATGLAASFAAAGLLRRRSGAPPVKGLLMAGYLLAAGIALAAPALGGAALIAAAAIAGLATALVTVPLAASLRDLLGSEAGRWGSFGLRVGLGTGIAYLFCNLPPVFAAGPERRCAISAAVALAGLAAAWRLQPRAGALAPAGPALADGDQRGLGLASLLLSFLALIWLDSAAFAVIQEEAGLKGRTWGDASQTTALGVVHLLAALGAGRAIDRGRFRGLLLGSFGLFAAALGLLGAAPDAAGLAARLAGPLYAAAVSIYSVALVAFPACGREAAGLVERRWRAAGVFGGAGWIGSALGVGMAQNLHAVPPLFLAAAGLLLAGAWLLRPGGRRPPWRRWLSLHGATLFFLLGGGIYFGLAGGPEAGAEPAGPVAASPGEAALRGRRVYIAEGCIYCHSQYVRPGTPDEARWGPHRGLDRARERPPLIGLRRQGPDLSNVGRRRGAASLARQLDDPRAISPFSAMPAYRHLFAPGDRRGADLVAYLESLR